MFQENTKREPRAVERMLFGAIAGAIGQTMSYPFDVVRRRIQTANLINADEANLNARQLFYKIIKEEGVRKGLYKGISMNWIKGSLRAGIGFMSFDILQLFTRKLLVKLYND